MTVIIFIIILAVLVLVHELGHFTVAKLSGVRVDEFGLGFPPRIFGIKKGETTYSLNAIPFGGFVKIYGEDGLAEEAEKEIEKAEQKKEAVSEPKLDMSRSFIAKPRWIQALVLVAGIAFNILFAWIIISAGFMIGMPVPTDYSVNAHVSNPYITVTSVDPGSPADKAGLTSGDELVGLVSGKDTLPSSSFSIQAVQDFISSHSAQPITFTYRRGTTIGSTSITPATGIVAGRAAIGISLDVIGTLKLPFFQAFWEGAKLTWSVLEETVVGLYSFIAQAVVGHAQLSEVTGPVGIAGLVGDAAKLGFVYVLSFTAFISINLAVINLIPFPALDGGRLLFVLIEKIKGSAINPKIANVINTVGFALLILLMLIVTYHDIFNLVTKH